MSLSDRAALQLSRPRLGTTLSEPLRASGEFGAAVLGLMALARKTPAGDGRPVLTLPGYGGADGSMAGVRRFLQACGYSPYKLQMGRNLDNGSQRIRSVDDASRFRETMVRSVIRRVGQIYAQTGRPVTLVGWSLGGVYAVDVSQQVPAMVRQVITLGSPFGDPRGTALFDVMRKISGSTVPLEAQDYEGWNSKAELVERSVPISVIYSDRDGIVSTQITRLKNDGHVRYHQVDSSHVGFAYNLKAYRCLAGELARA